MATIKFKFFGDRTIDDKLAHQIIGTLIAFFVGAIRYYFFANTELLFSGFIGFLSAVVVGFLKECYDKYIKKTEFGIMDWVATSSGGSVGAIVMIAVFWILILTHQ